MAGDVTVDGGARLGGHGSVGGSLNVAGSGGHVAPGDSIGTLTINGNATFASGSVLDYEFGTPGATAGTFGVGDSIHVGGNLALDGTTLNVTNFDGKMGPGLYNLFMYGGTLSETNGGITLGSKAGQTLAVVHDTGEINLFDGDTGARQFWDSDKAPNTTTGGTGT